MNLRTSSIKFGSGPMSGKVVPKSDTKPKPNNTTLAGKIVPRPKTELNPVNQPLAGKVIPKPESKPKTKKSLILGGILLGLATIIALAKKYINNQNK